MSESTKRFESGGKKRGTKGSARGRNLSRRGFLGAGVLAGLAALTFPTEHAYAWSSWTNATSPVLKNIGMGDCVHEDLVQISYARMLRSHAGDAAKPDGLLNPWAGVIQGDGTTASIAGDTVERGGGKTFAGADDLAARLFRENLAYLRIGSFWNDAASNTLVDFAASCYYANDIPKFTGNDYYTGAWDVGRHLRETAVANKGNLVFTTDALVQFTMNDRNNFIHGLLSSTASRKAHLKQSEVKQFALQWLGVAYEYARTGEVTATSDVTKDQAEQIFNGFIDTYEQLDENAHDMRVSLKVSNSEASLAIPHRRLRLRALGMVCHTLEDFWCPSHTCRTYRAGDGIPKNAILAFSNYKLQNGTKPPMLGYHIPFDRYAVSDAKNATNWREALTRGTGGYPGTEQLANVLDDKMSCLEGANTYFNTLGMNETIECVTKLFEFMYQGTAWDDGVRAWFDEEILPTYFDDKGQSLVCDAGRRSLHTPTYVIAPIKAIKRAYRKVGLSANHSEVIEAAKGYDAWQRGAHRFYSGKFNTSQSKYVMPGFESSSIWDDAEGERRLVDLTNKLYEGFESLGEGKRAELLARAGCNGCHGMMAALGRVRGMLQEFSIDLRGALRPEGDETMGRLAELRSFFLSGLKGQDLETASDSLSTQALLATAADEGDGTYVTAHMTVENVVGFVDGSYVIAVRDMDSLETSVMSVPANTPGMDRLEEGIGNLTITYCLEMEFDEDPDYRYVVTKIDYPDTEEDILFANGTVKSVSADEKTLVLDLHGMREYTFAVRDGVSVPQAGAYGCVRYSVGDAALEMVAFDELDDPGDLIEVTYPVDRVFGSSILLLTNEGENYAEDGYRDYIQVDYGFADVFDVPREGEKLTVFYHDELYGDTTDVDEHEVATASLASGFTNVSEQADGDDINDSVDSPGYIDLGDDYAEPTYGNEVIHVANAIGRPGEPPAPRQKKDDEKTDDEKTDDGKKDDTSRQKPKSELPKTADPLVGLEGLASAAAVGGAAMVARSASRKASEEGSAEEE
ncbi:MAG: hypothetical protein J6D54_05440 [Olsenella sp.]|nr:hypothetical protein [Olsenella sp.]